MGQTRMARMAYCWRCKGDVPMLDEREWAQIEPVLRQGIALLQDYRLRHGATLQEARQHVPGEDAIRRYHQLTGFTIGNADAIWHHRLSGFGPPCSSCGKLLRTPRAKFCAACGASVQQAP